MNNRFIAFDVETPNANNNRISAIGITIVENGKIVDERYTLVDPETHFDYFNIRLTGITPEAVEGKPNFPQLWKEIRPLMDSRACAELLLDYMDHGLPVDKYLRRYDISSVRARRSLR